MSNQMTSLSNFVKINPESITKAYPHDEILYIDISSVGSGYIVESPKTLSINESLSRAKRIIRDGDTILATVRPNLRSFMFIKEPEKNTIASTGFAVLRAKNNADPRFIYYAVTDRRFTGYLTNNTKGTSYPAVDMDTILRGEIPDFGLRQQRVIASILSAYDDLIENNRRRIQLLEQTARLLYKEWFVHLRFPGHEHVPIINGVPEGWRKKPLYELVATQYGFTETATDESIGPRFLRGTDINKTSYIDWSTVSYCPGDKCDFKKYALQVGDIVVIRMADPGKVAIVETEEKAVFASYLVRLTQKTGVDIPSLYLFFVLSDDSYQGFISGASGGATRKSASAKLLVDFNIFVPSPKLMVLFVEQVHPLRQQIQKLLQHNSSLRWARDLLLPRLMNGKVSI